MDCRLPWEKDGSPTGLHSKVVLRVLTGGEVRLGDQKYSLSVLHSSFRAREGLGRIFVCQTFGEIIAQDMF